MRVIVFSTFFYYFPIGHIVYMFFSIYFYYVVWDSRNLAMYYVSVHYDDFKTLSGNRLGLSISTLNSICLD